jgi:hypothetical protein
VVNNTPRSLNPRVRDAVPIVQESGRAPVLVWTGAENLAHSGIRFPDRPGSGESLYRLGYPGPKEPYMGTTFSGIVRERSIVTRLQVSVPAGARDLFLPKFPVGSGSHLAHYLVGTSSSFSGISCLGRKAGHSSVTEVMNGWSHNSTPNLPSWLSPGHLHFASLCCSVPSLCSALLGERR